MSMSRPQIPIVISGYSKDEKRESSLEDHSFLAVIHSLQLIFVHDRNKVIILDSTLWQVESWDEIGTGKERSKGRKRRKKRRRKGIITEGDEIHESSTLWNYTPFGFIILLYFWKRVHTSFSSENAMLFFSLFSADIVTLSHSFLLYFSSPQCTSSDTIIGPLFTRLFHNERWKWLYCKGLSDTSPFLFYSRSTIEVTEWRITQVILGFTCREMKGMKRIILHTSPSPSLPLHSTCTMQQQGKLLLQVRANTWNDTPRILPLHYHHRLSEIDQFLPPTVSPLQYLPEYTWAKGTSRIHCSSSNVTTERGNKGEIKDQSILTSRECLQWQWVQWRGQHAIWFHR